MPNAIDTRCCVSSGWLRKIPRLIRLAGRKVVRSAKTLASEKLSTRHIQAYHSSCVRHKQPFVTRTRHALLTGLRPKASTNRSCTAGGIGFISPDVNGGLLTDSLFKRQQSAVKALSFGFCRAHYLGCYSQAHIPLLRRSLCLHNHPWPPPAAAPPP